MTAINSHNGDSPSFEDIVSQIRSPDKETRELAVGRIPILLLRSFERRDELLDQVLLMIHNLVCIDSEPYEKINLSNRTKINRNLLRAYSATSVHDEIEVLAKIVKYADSSELLVELANVLHNCTLGDEKLSDEDDDTIRDAIDAIQEKATANLYHEALLMILSIRSLRMPGQRPILAMSFIASLGITFQVLACTLPRNQGNFWPLLVYIFYLILPLPILFSRRIIKETMIGMNAKDSARATHYAIFLSAGIMVSSFALPILLARSPVDKPVIAPISCFLVEVGNLLCYTTVSLFCIYFKPLAA